MRAEFFWNKLALGKDLDNAVQLVYNVLSVLIAL